MGKESDNKTASIYDKLGGIEGLTTIVEGLFNKIQYDPALQ